MTKDYQRRYYQANKEKIKRRAKDWYWGKGKTRELQRCRQRDAASPERLCIVCGTPYRKRHKATVTCNDRCRYELTARRLSGWCHVPIGSLELGAEKRLKHPHTGPFVTNLRAKDGWSLISPDGDVFRFRNMNHFVREHKELFDDADVVGCETGSCLAAQQLRRLNPKRKGHIKSWKGWEWACQGWECIKTTVS